LTDNTDFSRTIRLDPPASVKISGFCRISTADSLLASGYRANASIKARRLCQVGARDKKKKREKRHPS
jgi:hypothetical protein